jgi:hypothetical protein
MAPPGSTSVEVEVYDVAQKVKDLTFTADVLRFQAQGNELQGVRLFAVDNKSSPPRTQMTEKSLSSICRTELQWILVRRRPRVGSR